MRAWRELRWARTSRIESLGLADFIQRSDPIILANGTGKRWHDMVKSGNGYDALIEWLRPGEVELIREPQMARSVWDRVTDNADWYYQPGVFTSFHGFEWTSHPGVNNMHRVVNFRDSKERTSQVVPFSRYGSVDPEDLRIYLSNYEASTGGRVLAIPNNGNLSNGLMFARRRYNGGRMTEQYVQTRKRWEPLAEVTQQTGDGETHPLLSPDDIFAVFEALDAAWLMAYWEDPDFDPTESAFYYVRVLEIPTPRWTAYDAKFFGVTMPPDTVLQLQERAYTSPIWYTP